MTTFPQFYRLLILISAALMFFAYSVPAKADIVYNFIKVECHPESRTATLQAFYDQNESGKERSQHPEKGTYYLGDIARKSMADEFPSKSEMIKVCDFDNKKSLYFVANEDQGHRISDGLMLFLTNNGVTKEINRFFGLNNEGEWTLQVHSIGADKLELNLCPDEPGIRKANGCTVTHTHDAGNVYSLIGAEDDK